MVGRRARILGLLGGRGVMEEGGGCMIVIVILIVRWRLFGDLGS
jgi:hypothetical protein